MNDQKKPSDLKQDTWRQNQRRALLARRTGMHEQRKRAADNQIHRLIIGPLKDMIPHLDQTTVGFYWPVKGEVDLRPVMTDLANAGTKALLPLVVGRAMPLDFRHWAPGDPMQPGTYGIPVPSNTKTARPMILFIPLVGFDSAGYRLGYGGGLYDRTLASYSHKPITIGVGYSFGQLDSIRPLATDIPLDIILTEQGIMSPEGITSKLPDTPQPASPPCTMNEMSPEYFGYLDTESILALLDQLLEAERAGARGVASLSRQASDPATHDLLHEVAGDEARFCAMLSGHIMRLGATPSRKTGAFYDKLMAVKDHTDSLVLLNRGQDWVARTIRDILPRIQDGSLHKDLKHMLDVHVENIRRCDALLANESESDERIKTR